MPTNRTKKIRETIAHLLQQQPSWDSRRLRKSCLDAIGDGDAMERAKLGNSIRRTVTQLIDAGVLALGEKESVLQGPAFDTLVLELAAEQTAQAKPSASVTAKEAEGKKPKEKDMRIFLSELFEKGSFSEAEIVEKAVLHFGVKGERVHGVRGLTLQILKAQLTEGTIAFADGVYSKTEAVAACAETSPQKRETPRRATAVKVQRVTRSKPRTAVTVLAADEVLDEKSFASLINQKGGDFFNVLVAKLLETYYDSVGVRVSGRFVVDGSEDRGIDVIFHVVDGLGFSDKVAVQAKTRARSQIALKELREFYGCAHAEGATKGIFVTTATFTTEAVEFLRKNDNLTGLDAVKLFELACRHEICIRYRDGKPYAAPELLK